MKKYTQNECLNEIFYNNSEPLSNRMLVSKHRYKNKTLSQKAIDEILIENGYTIIQEALYAKKL
jgi:hypothetical protein